MIDTRIVVAALPCALLAACSSAPLKPLPAPIAGNFGEVVVYREWAFAAGGIPLTVGVKDGGFVLLSNSEKVTARLTPGEHEVFVQARSSEPTKLRIAVKNGDVLCLRTSASSSTYAKTALPPVLMITGYQFYLDEVPCPSHDELAKYKEVGPTYEAPGASQVK
jgi:hypothetical protein